VGIANITTNENRTRTVQEAWSRAARFPVQLPIRYRLPHSPEWFEARTENVSHTGVLLRTESIFKPNTILDLRLELPSPVGNGSPAAVVCKCEVVRVEQTRGRGAPPALALAILNYRLRRQPRPQLTH
jgi:hypothetical protein